ncbi:RNA-directed DNA polymerase, eukaryota, reverse transcriptase zinc-binding domain protein [Tanacetum coccineum]
MENTCKKKHDDLVQDIVEEIRAENKSLNDELGETEGVIDKGVFGNMDKGVFGNENYDMHCDTNDDEITKVSSVSDSQSTFHNHTNNDNWSNVGRKLSDTFANMVKKDEIPKKLSFKPTIVTDNGVEVVIFDEVLTRKGCERWNLTVSGHFVGYKMAPNELRYNIRRMWAKYGVRDIIVNYDGTCLFKFKDIEGLNSVIEKGPWMVPLEAWSVDGISALASSLGNPLIMDTMTANMCHNGVGRLNFARVLVEMEADKEFKKSIEVQYRDSVNNIKGTKKVNVSYDWKPLVCSHCQVFGHNLQGYKNRPRTMDTMKEDGKGTNWRKNTDREKQTVENQEQSKENNGMTWNKGKWELNNKEFQAMKKSANKYSILNSLPEDDLVELDMLKGRMIADQYLNKKVQPSKEEISKWSLDMVGYFKMKWNEARIKGWVEEDILSDNEVENVIANEIGGRGNNLVNLS